MSTWLCQSRCTTRWEKEADVKTHVYLPQDNLLYHNRDLTNAADLPSLRESSRRCAVGTGAFSSSSTSDKSKQKNKEEHRHPTFRRWTVLRELRIGGVLSFVFVR